MASFSGRGAVGGGVTGAGSGALSGAAIGAAGGPIGMLGGAAIGGLTGLVGGGLSGGGDDEIMTFDQFLSPQQRRVLNTTEGRIQALLGGQTEFTGPLTAPIGRRELENIEDFRQTQQLANARLRALINPDEAQFRQDFQEEIVNPTFDVFRNEVAPLITENLPSFSTARGRAIQRAGQDLQGQILGTRFQSREAARDRSLDAITGARRLATTGAQLFSIPRQIEQAGLTNEFQRFVTGNELARNNISAALDFLGLGGSAFIPGPTDAEQLLTGANIGKIAGNSLTDLVDALENSGQTTSEPGINVAANQFNPRAAAAASDISFVSG